jgi:DNA repair ATPase RecN
VSNDLKAAQAELEALRGELPNFHSLLTDNERELERLKAERAELVKQAEARGRVNVSREMLEQHQSDIATAQAEVSRLEHEAQRQATLAKMAHHAKQAQMLRERYDNELKAAAAQLEKRLDSLREIKAGLHNARKDFYAAGHELVPDAFARQHPTRGMTRADNIRNVETAAPVIAELSDVDLSYVLTTYNPLVQFRLDNPHSPHECRYEGEFERFLNEQAGL